MYNKAKEDCPRGFILKEKKCVPEQKGVEDKLVLKFERYFFKEGKEMEKDCDKGFKWCPMMKKCMPEDHFKGKMGMKMKEANDLVDIAFDEGFETFGKAAKAHRKVDRILDGVKNPEEVDLGQGTSYQSRPYDHPKKVRVVAKVEECDMYGNPSETGGGMMGGGSMNKGISKPDTEEEYEDSYDANPNDDPNDIDHVPNQDGASLYKSLRKQMGEWLKLDRKTRLEARRSVDK